MTSLGALLSISAWLFTKNAKQLQGDYEGSIISLSNKVFISFLQYSNNLGLIWIDLAFIGISFSLNSGIYGNFTISCSTKIGVSLPEIYEAMYTYRAWSGDPVDENSPFCTTTIPSVADFGQVNKGSSKEIKLTGTLVCDKDADVDANLLVQFSSEKGVLNLTGTKIHFGFDDNSVLKRFKLKANTPVNFPVIFKVADTVDTAGLKDGYVLLRTEVP